MCLLRPHLPYFEEAYTHTEAAAAAAADAHSREDLRLLVEPHTWTEEADGDSYSTGQEAVGLPDGHLSAERRGQPDLAGSRRKAGVQVDD